MSEADSDPVKLAELERHKINLETARIAWSELERHFASGRLIAVAASLDLVAVAQAFARDDKNEVEVLLQARQLQPVSDEQARRWHEDATNLWAVVVKPWVLVQDKNEAI